MSIYKWAIFHGHVKSSDILYIYTIYIYTIYILYIYTIYIYTIDILYLKFSLQKPLSTNVFLRGSRPSWKALPPRRRFRAAPATAAWRRWTNDVRVGVRKKVGKSAGKRWDFYDLYGIYMGKYGISMIYMGFIWEVLWDFEVPWDLYWG